MRRLLGTMTKEKEQEKKGLYEALASRTFTVLQHATNKLVKRDRENFFLMNL